MTRLTSNEEFKSIETANKDIYANANLVITGERLFHDSIASTVSDVDLRLVRPRKLPGFEGLPDIN